MLLFGSNPLGYLQRQCNSDVEELTRAVQLRAAGAAAVAQMAARGRGVGRGGTGAPRARQRAACARAAQARVARTHSRALHEPPPLVQATSSRLRVCDMITYTY